MSMRVLSVFGTRPEAIKMAPVVTALAAAGLDARTCVTAQHRDMLDQVLALFGIRPDYDLDIMRPGQDLNAVTTRVIAGLQPVLAELRPDLVLVHGDTTTSMAAALAAFHAGLAVGHVEAGLRTGDIAAPWPEEMNRRVTATLAQLHFAPTDRARANLIAEGVADRHIRVTGNTVVDAMQAMCARLETEGEGGVAHGERFDGDPDRRLILVTCHRREAIGGGLEDICDALARLARRSDVQIVFPVHPNPQIRQTVEKRLGGLAHLMLIAPLNYLAFVRLMRLADLVITDSGGVQEEAPALGKPVLVTRQTTERPEAVALGAARMVGTDADTIVRAVEEVLDDDGTRQTISGSHYPYGDGQAAHRIVDAIHAWHTESRPEGAF